MIIKWKIIAIALTVMLSVVVNVEILAASNGQCGENVFWTLNDEGLLTISGSGEMTNYDLKGTDVSPWFRNANVVNVIIENGVTSIGDCAFYKCGSLSSVTIPNSVASIGSSALAGCLSLTSVVIPDGVTNIETSAFGGCNGLTSIDIPSSVTSIGSFAFLKSVNLTRVTMPNSITDINGDVFWNCTSLASIDIPGSVKKIGDYAFRNCSSLRSIYAYAAEPPMCGKFTFEGVDKDLCKLYVLEESIPAYSTADEWKDFQTILLGVDTVSADGLNVVAVDGMIFIGGVADDAVVEVYSMGGALVYRGSGKSVAVPQAGVYIVSVAGSAVKVMAK